MSISCASGDSGEKIPLVGLLGPADSTSVSITPAGVTSFNPPSQLDWFHWNYSFAWFIIMLELIIGTIPREPPIRLLSMPASTMLFTFAVELLLFEALRLFYIPSPCRISSMPKGSPLRPGIYSIIEDVVAVDGSGGTAYRERLNARHEASPMFRQMLIHLTWFWAGGAALIASATTVVIFTVPGPAAYGVRILYATKRPVTKVTFS